MAKQDGVALPASGFLENVPSSWLVEWMRSLPHRDKLALFQASKWLAQQVVAHTKRISLNLPGLFNRVTAEVLSKPHDIIPQLLMHASHDATINAWTSWSALQAYATSIGKWVFALNVLKNAEDCTAAPACLSTCWGAFANLSVLRFFSGTTEQDIEQLCEALHADHLHQLQQFYLGEDQVSTQALQKVARALQAGTCLTRISACSLHLIDQIHGYRSLQTVCIYSCYLSKDFIRQLCEHATLQNVELDNCSLEKCADWPVCRWKSLTLTYCDMKVLASLPLACIQKVVFCRTRATKDKQDVEALQDALTNHAAKLVCGNNFCLLGVCQHTAQLVKHLRNQHELEIWNFVCSPSVLKDMWRALPACITFVAFWRSKAGYIEGMDLANFWESMPNTITHVTIAVCELVPVATLIVLVRAAPAHVQNLKIACGSTAVRATLQAAGLHDVAPAHLTLDL